MIKEIQFGNEVLRIELSNDKQGRIVWKCPKCKNTLLTFYSEVETIGRPSIEKCSKCNLKLLKKGEINEEDI